MSVLGGELLELEELKQLIESAEQAGSVRVADLNDFVEAHGLDPLEVDALHREFEQRGIELVEAAPEPAPQQPLSFSYETTTDARQLFLREAGRHAEEELERIRGRLVREAKRLLG